jgi:rhodanese-related sulfurtransferase
LVDFLQQNWYWAALAAASGGMLLSDVVRNGRSGDQLSPIEATMLINRENAVVIDVREQAEYAQGHIPNARHIPLKDLEQQKSELESLREQPVILCCVSGARSAGAAAQLRKAGFERIYNLRGGLLEWEKAGQPVSRKKKK